MEAGKRNTKVTILHFTQAQDDAGQPVKTWVPFKSVYANVRNLGGLETLKAGAETSVVNGSIRINFRRDITNAMRVQVGTVVYEIKAVLPDEAGRKHVDLVCEVAQ